MTSLLGSLIDRGILLEGADWGISKNVPFWHSEGSHPLTLYLIETLFALKWSWQYKLHEDVLGCMCVALCANWQRPKAQTDYQKLNTCSRGFSWEKAQVNLHHLLHHFTIHLTPFLLQWRLNVATSTSYHPKFYELVRLVACFEDFVVQSKARATEIEHGPQHLQSSSSALQPTPPEPPEPPVRYHQSH